MSYSREQPSARYKELIEQYRSLHLRGDAGYGLPPQATFDGRSLPRQAQRIRRLIKLSDARTILDYGSGKGTQYVPAKIFENGIAQWNSIQEYWGVDKIQCYDPGFEPLSAWPQSQFDGVVCTDVLEHCPEDDLPWIVSELFRYSRRFVFASVACYPANKKLPSGENAHCTIRDADYWERLFLSAAERSPGVLWELWAETARNKPGSETRRANFEPLPERPQVPLWRMV